jgi:hypothetical protein
MQPVRGRCFVRAAAAGLETASRPRFGEAQSEGSLMNAGSDRRNGARWLGRAGVAAALTLAIAGCTNATLVNVWRDPSFSGHRVRALMVVSRAQDPTARRLWEDAVRSQMMKDGVEVVASYQMFADAPPSKAALQKAVEERGLDAALVLKPLSPTASTRWVPGWTSTEARTFYDPWVRRNEVVFRDRYHRGFHYTERFDRQQVTLWTAGDDARMVWAGTVLVPSRGAGELAADDIAKGVVPAMKKEGLL